MAWLRAVRRLVISPPIRQIEQVLRRSYASEKTSSTRSESMKRSIAERRAAGLYPTPDHSAASRINIEKASAIIKSQVQAGVWDKKNQSIAGRENIKKAQAATRIKVQAGEWKPSLQFVAKLQHLAAHGPRKTYHKLIQQTYLIMQARWNNSSPAS